MTRKVRWNSEGPDRIMRIALLFRIGVPAWMGLTVIHLRLNSSGRLSDGAMYGWLAADPILAVGIAYLIGTVIDRAGTGFASLVLAGGNIPYANQYSEQDALIARGATDEAIASFEALIASNPRDLDARLRLADLFAGPAARPHDAERVFLEVRSLAPNLHQSAILSNGLIDLYRAPDRRADLKLELGRFARRFPDSSGGQAAAAYLQRLQVEDGAPT